MVNFICPCEMTDKSLTEIFSEIWKSEVLFCISETLHIETSPKMCRMEMSLQGRHSRYEGNL